MKTLLLLRHAKSSWDNPGQSDHDRPLNKRGKRDAPRIGHLIEQEGLVPDHIVSSTAARARTTAQTVAESCGFKDEIQQFGELYHAPPTAYRAVLSRLPADCHSVLAVGHNPGIEEFQMQLTGQFEPMPTAALAQIGIDIEHWDQLGQDVEAQLIRFWRPRELDD